MSMTHVSIDLETLGKVPGCAIVALGAVAFNPRTGAVGGSFYTPIDLKSCMQLGLRCDASTIYWWLGQSDQARKALLAPAKDVRLALSEFETWVRLNNIGFVWGHGATFDVSVLEAAYRIIHKKDAPWEYWSARDTRTLFDLSGVKVARDPYTAHNALADAKAQAQAIIESYKKLGKTA